MKKKICLNLFIHIKSILGIFGNGKLTKSAKTSYFLHVALIITLHSIINLLL